MPEVRAVGAAEVFLAVIYSMKCVGVKSVIFFLLQQERLCHPYPPEKGRVYRVLPIFYILLYEWSDFMKYAKHLKCLYYIGKCSKYLYYTEKALRICALTIAAILGVKLVSKCCCSCKALKGWM